MGDLLVLPAPERDRECCGCGNLYPPAAMLPLTLDAGDLTGGPIALRACSSRCLGAFLCRTGIVLMDNAK